MQKAELWFQKDVFKDLQKEEDEDFELDKMIEEYKSTGGKLIQDQNKIITDVPNIQKRKTIEEVDSNYDIEQRIEPKKKEEKIGGKEGFEIVSKENGKRPLF